MLSLKSQPRYFLGKISALVYHEGLNGVMALTVDGCQGGMSSMR